MDMSEIKDALKDKGFKTLVAEKIIDKMSEADKKKAIRKFKKKYQNHPDYNGLLAKFKKDLKYEKYRRD